MVNPISHHISSEDRKVLITQANISLKYMSEQCLILTTAVEQLINDKARAVKEYVDGPRLRRLELDILEITSANNDIRRLNKHLSVVVKSWASSEGAVVVPEGIDTHVISELYVTFLALNEQLRRAYGKSDANEALVQILTMDLKKLNSLL